MPLAGIIALAALLTCGPPVLGVVCSSYLWRRARKHNDANLRRYERFSFAALALAFSLPLLFNASALLIPPRYTDALAYLLRAWPLFSATAALLSIGSAGILIWKCRGRMRVFAPLLGGIALIFSFVNIVSLLAGAAGI